MNLTKVVIFMVKICLLIGCSSEVDVVLKKKQSVELVNSWTFNTESDFTFDSNFIEFNNNTAKLKQVDQSFSKNDFNLGSHLGTKLNSNQNLSIIQKTDTSLDIKNILPLLNSNLIGYWRMDGDWQDSSGNGNHGTGFDNADFQDESIVGIKSGSFDGALDYVDVGSDSSLDITNKLSISLWTKVDSEPDSNRLISRHMGPGNYGWLISREETNDSLEFSASVDGNNWSLNNTGANTFEIGV